MAQLAWTDVPGATDAGMESDERDAAFSEGDEQDGPAVVASISKDGRRRTDVSEKEILEKAFEKDSFPDKAARLKLAQRLDWPEKKVARWMQNKRQRNARKGRSQPEASTSAGPPTRATAASKKRSRRDEDSSEEEQERSESEEAIDAPLPPPPVKLEPVEAAVEEMPDDEDGNPYDLDAAMPRPGSEDDFSQPRGRHAWDPAAHDLLDRAYRKDPKPSKEMREVLSRKTGVELSKVTRWFQNRRQRAKARSQPLSRAGSTQQDDFDEDADSDMDLDEPYADAPQRTPSRGPLKLKPSPKKRKLDPVLEDAVDEPLGRRSAASSASAAIAMTFSPQKHAQYTPLPQADSIYADMAAATPLRQTRRSSVVALHEADEDFEDEVRPKSKGKGRASESPLIDAEMFADTSKPRNAKRMAVEKIKPVAKRKTTPRPDTVPQVGYRPMTRSYESRSVTPQVPKSRSMTPRSSTPPRLSLGAFPSPSFMDDFAAVGLNRSRLNTPSYPTSDVRSIRSSSPDTTASVASGYFAPQPQQEQPITSPRRSSRQAAMSFEHILNPH